MLQIRRAEVSVQTSSSHTFREETAEFTAEVRDECKHTHLRKGRNKYFGVLDEKL